MSEIERTKTVNRLAASVQYHMSLVSGHESLREATLMHLRIANEALMAIRLIVSDKHSDALSIQREYLKKTAPKVDITETIRRDIKAGRRSEGR